MTTLTSPDNIKRLFVAGLHFGHPKTKWNSKIKPFLFGSRQGIHIFDLTKTATFFTKALDFLRDSSAQGKTILFVSTKPQAQNLLIDLATSLNLPFVTEKWFGGLLTNWCTTQERLKQLKALKEEKAKTDFARYLKKERNKKLKQIKKLELWLAGIEGLTQKPDVVFILDTVYNKLAVLEAKKCKIPVVGVVDSNADPDLIDYPIPANDDSLSAIQLILNEIHDAIQAGKQNSEQEKNALNNNEKNAPVN